MSMCNLEFEHLVKLHFGEFGVGAKEFSNFLGVVLLGIASDLHHQRATLDVLVVESAEVVHGETADLLGDFGTVVVGPTNFHIIMDKRSFVNIQIVSGKKQT